MVKQFNQAHLSKVVDVYGVKLSEIDSMKFSKYLSNNPNLPAPNTLQPEERKQLVLDFLRLQSNKISNKLFYETHGVGKAKYTVSYHDGKKFHQDGSPFFDIYICSSKQRLSAFIDSLEAKGYIRGK